MDWHKYLINNQDLYFSNGEVSFRMIKVPNQSFYIGETPVTQHLWECIMGDNPSHFTGNLLCPVDNISYHDCTIFIAKLNELTKESFRLPLMREWVLAAVGGEGPIKPLYAGSNSHEEVGWFDKRTHPVKLKKPNAIGVFDMTGNVWEWCSDIAPTQYLIDGSPKEVVRSRNGEETIPTFRYLKGGSCINGPSTSKITSRNSFGEYYRCLHLGMRLVL